ncbi:MAG: hypothetical protein V4708_09955 [Bacteroidota bacterium]
MLKRRKFLELAGIGGAFLLLPVSIFFAVKSLEDIAVDLIVKEFHYLRLDHEGVKKYVRDYLQKDKPGIAAGLKWRSYYVLNFNSSDSDNIKFLVTYYLLSSDFFINKMDETKEVKYMGINHQYTAPCSSHFSFMIFPEEAQKAT